jgi:translation initiation factor IF-3
MDKIILAVTDVAAPESLPRMEGRNMSVLLTPR